MRQAFRESRGGFSKALRACRSLGSGSRQGVRGPPQYFRMLEGLAAVTRAKTGANAHRLIQQIYSADRSVSHRDAVTNGDEG